MSSPGVTAAAMSAMITTAIKVVVPIIPVMAASVNVHIIAVRTVPAVVITHVRSVPVSGSSPGDASSGDQGKAA
jgi:hypothetical protein